LDVAMVSFSFSFGVDVGFFFFGGIDLGFFLD
jgi:hypothetical protein